MSSPDRPEDDPSPGDDPPATRLRLIRNGIRTLESRERDAPRRTAEWILSELLDCNRAALYTRANEPVPSEVEGRFNELIERRAAGEPLQHVLGYTSFRGLRVDVSPAVMIPRPETEQVVETVLQAIDDVEAPRVLDVGTGSGCIALAVKHERPDAHVYACDVSTDALRVARRNSRRLGLDVTLIEANLFSDTFSSRVPNRLDVLVSNPPYVPESEADTLSPVVREYDPDVALFARNDPLRFYRALAGTALALCTPEADVVLEVHAHYANEVAELLQEHGLVGVQIQPDLAGRPRIVRGRLGREIPDRAQ